jgi:hypothetical protein
MYSEWCRKHQPSFCRQFTLKESNFLIRHHAHARAHTHTHAHIYIYIYIYICTYINKILKYDWREKNISEFWNALVKFHGIGTFADIFYWLTKDFLFCSCQKYVVSTVLNWEQEVLLRGVISGIQCSRNNARAPTTKHKYDTRLFRLHSWENFETEWAWSGYKINTFNLSGTFSINISFPFVFIYVLS